MAVYTHVDETALRDFLAAYDLPKLTAFQGIKAGVQNTNYLLTLADTKYILTLYEDTQNGVDPEDLPYFLQLKQHLAARGIACPTPVAQRDGALFSPLQGRPAALVSFLSGRSSKSPTPAHCRALGAAMANMHVAGADFSLQRANTQGHQSWSALFDNCRAEADNVTPGLGATIERELDRLVTAWPSDLPRGVVHADLFPDNVFFDNGNLTGLIDFYFACTDYLAYDLAIALNAWCFEHDASFNITKARALLAGYQQNRPMQADEIDALPVLAGGAAMRFLLTRLYDWLHPQPDGLVVPKNPVDYLQRLRFHKSVRHARDYGLES